MGDNISYSRFTQLDISPSLSFPLILEKFLFWSLLKQTVSSYVMKSIINIITNGE